MTSRLNLNTHTDTSIGLVHLVATFTGAGVATGSVGACSMDATNRLCITLIDICNVRQLKLVARNTRFGTQCFCLIREGIGQVL